MRLCNISLYVSVKHAANIRQTHGISPPKLVKAIHYNATNLNSSVPTRKIFDNEKNMKTLTIRNKIEEHDLQTKIKNIQKWLERGQSIKLVVQNVTSEKSRTESLYNTLLKSLESKGKLEKQLENEKEMRLIIQPTLHSADKTFSASTTPKK